MMKKIYILLIVLSLGFMTSGCDIIREAMIGECECDETCVMDTINSIATKEIKANVIIRGYSGLFSSISSVQGSGVIFKIDDDEVYVLTNNHVINTSSATFDQLAFRVFDHSNEAYSASVLCNSEELDLAILKFQSIYYSDLGKIELASENAANGSYVYAVGSPNGQINSVTVGHLTSYIELEDVEYKIIKHDAPIDHGSSGGMLLDNNLKLIGINTWGLTIGSQAVEDYGGAIPISIIRDYLVERGFEEFDNNIKGE